ncbi:MAG TPA: MarR family transcriptional regulator [Casimicrobiaceae bacterium]|jgi:DNA-binding MarR family transcriptional regulator|nr:MarR family transcriptional regulator [Casimicrobiaceae bacterium]
MAPIYDPANFDPYRSVARLMTRVKSEMMNALDRELAPFGVSAAQYVVLVRLAYGTNESASALCEGVSYDPGAMTRMIDRLEAKGLVRRVRTPSDRRRVLIELTDEGHAICPELIARAVGVLNRFLDGFTQDDLAKLEVLLQRMLANA